MEALPCPGTQAVCPSREREQGRVRGREGDENVL